MFGYATYTSEYYWILYSLLCYKVVELIGDQIGLHRYFAHRAFKTGPIRHQLLCWSSIMVAQGTILGHTAVHRSHHKHPDTDKDVHTPFQLSLWDMFLLHFKNEEYYREKTTLVVPRDLLRDKTVMFNHHRYIEIWITYLILSSIISYFVGWQFLVFFVFGNIGWNVFHGTLRIYLYHLNTWGSYRNFDLRPQGDYSTNNQWIHYWDTGEGLHNNHHMYPNSYTMAVKPNEFDLAGWTVKHFFLVDDGKDLQP
jgi:stearoyl-CoA desaturase (delta-9 desaturase)